METGDARPAAIAFLFLTYKGLTHERLWRAFFDSAIDRELYGVFLHQKEQASTSFAACTVPTVPTRYGCMGIVDAELAMLTAALADTSRNYTKFVLLCGASVPLKSFDHVHHALTHDACAHFAEFREPAWAVRRGVPSFAGRLTPLEGTCPQRCFAKASQWWVLNRRLAALLTSQPPEYLALWQDTLVPDEHYMLSTIRYRCAGDEGAPEPPDVVCHAPDSSGDFVFPTYVCWSEPDLSQPVDWNGQDAVRPKTYSSLSAEEAVRLVESPALFGRKFGAECDGLWEMLNGVYSSSDRDTVTETQSQTQTDSSATSSDEQITMY